MHFIQAVQTEFALSAGAGNPLNSCAIAHLPPGFGSLSEGNDIARTFVARDSQSLLHHCHSEVLPFIVKQGFVRATKTSPVDLD